MFLITPLLFLLWPVNMSAMKKANDLTACVDYLLVVFRDLSKYPREYNTFGVYLCICVFVGGHLNSSGYWWKAFVAFDLFYSYYTLTFRGISYSKIKNDSPLWPCCDSACSRRCTWRSRWPVWSQVTPQKRPPLCWCSVDSADVSSSPCLVFLGSPSRAGRGKGISSQCSPPWTRAYCPQTPDSWGSLLRPAGDHSQSSDLGSHSISTQSRHFQITLSYKILGSLGS